MFDKDSILELSKSEGFVKRKRKLLAIALLEAMLFSQVNGSKVSLNDIVIYLWVEYNISITRQAIAKRFNQMATGFVRQLLQRLIKARLLNDQMLFVQSKFNRILIKDSTCSQLPDELKDCYPGSGGSGSGASVRLQFEYDLKNHEIQELSVNAFNHQDRTNAKETIADIQENDLIIRDLGFVSIGILELIAKREAFYISRLMPNVCAIDQQTGEEINFSALEKMMRDKNISTIEKQIKIGNHRTRLVIELVPEKVKEQRMRKASKEASKKSRVISKHKKARMGLNLYITNATSSMLSASELRRIYGIRWQIELVFKSWKQNIQMHKVKKMNVNRFEFMLYSKLILAVIYWKVHQVMDMITYQSKRQRISIQTTYKAMSLFINEIKQLLRGDVNAVKKFIEVIVSIPHPLLVLQQRMGRSNWKNVEII
jgi:hypothetical protein